MKQPPPMWAMRFATCAILQFTVGCVLLLVAPEFEVAALILWLPMALVLLAIAWAASRGGG